MTTSFDRTLAFRSVNEGVALVACDVYPGGDDWDFHCECGMRTCQQWVAMPLARFTAILAEPDRYVLAPDHPVPRARRARRLATQLREEAEALRAQALHQQRRARHSAHGRSAPEEGT